MRMSMFAPILLALGLLAGCARPQATTDTPAATTSNDASSAMRDAAPPAAHSTPASANQDVMAGRDRPPPRKSDGLPPQRVEAPNAPKLVTSCASDSDCAVKNVGSCCGAMPACVNKNSPVDPAAVQAECARKGISSTCGFKDIHSCSCVAGTCQDAGGNSTPVAH
ncbi:hypothetical protein [Cognatilysobacter terrigena]|uniref:hypothetical protein n=1 Tax=Cognatilysobacter terrigena TaxID=2488749 RepID=UPI00105C2C15|nr:hypothetical protein [Lysobacter terrigena]